MVEASASSILSVRAIAGWATELGFWQLWVMAVVHCLACIHGMAVHAVAYDTFQSLLDCPP